jgi:hypothetical protein
MSTYQKLRDIETLTDTKNTKLDTLNTNVGSVETAVTNTKQRNVEHWMVGGTDTSTDEGDRWESVQNNEGHDVLLKNVYVAYTTSITSGWHTHGFLDSSAATAGTLTIGRGGTGSFFNVCGQYKQNILLSPFLTHTHAFSGHTGYFYKIPCEEVIQDGQYVTVKFNLTIAGSGFDSITYIAEVVN